MDSFIAHYDGVVEHDLVVCAGNGVAYQSDMTFRVAYGPTYLRKISSYDVMIARAVNNGRSALLARHLMADASVLDIGAGDGSFVRCARSWGFVAHGYDIIQESARALLADGLYDDDPRLHDAVTMWDSIEHMAEPGLWLKRIRSYLFVSLPIFSDLSAIRASKHYRPSEHLYYWTAPGFVDWMEHYGFRLLEQSDHETHAGRESIGAFAFLRERS